MRRIGSLIGICTLTLAGTAVGVAFRSPLGAAAAPAEAAVAGLVRVDQVGYLPGDAKLAYPGWTSSRCSAMAQT